MPVSTKVISKKSKLLPIALLSALLLGTGCSEIQLISQAGKKVKQQTTDGSHDDGPILNGPENGGNGTHYKVGKAYKIKGQWYYPKEDYSYVEQGVASWYGPNFNKKPTANGAVFDMTKVSAAHRTLPLPSIVRVTNLENGRSLRVKVNDRGPYAHNRIIDMSKRAAELLGFIQQGTALVRVEVIESDSRMLAEYMRTGKLREDQPPAPEAAPVVAIDTETLDSNDDVETSTPTTTAHDVTTPVVTSSNTAERQVASLPQSDVVYENVTVGFVPGIFVQAGAFSKYANAARAQALLEPVGNVIVQQINKGDAPLFRVRAGPIKDVAAADKIQSAIVNAGFGDARVVVESK